MAHGDTSHGLAFSQDCFGCPGFLLLLCEFQGCFSTSMRDGTGTWVGMLSLQVALAGQSRRALVLQSLRAASSSSSVFTSFFPQCPKVLAAWGFGLLSCVYCDMFAVVIGNGIDSLVSFPDVCHWRRGGLPPCVCYLSSATLLRVSANSEIPSGVLRVTEAGHLQLMIL